MFRRFLYVSVGALVLVVMLGAPVQVHAQRMGAGFARGMQPGSRMGVMPGFQGGSNSRFNRNFFIGPNFMPQSGLGRFDRFEDRFENRFRSGRFDRFEDRFENRFRSGRFDRFEDRFDNRFNRGFFLLP
jgi:hypothetical protein